MSVWLKIQDPGTHRWTWPFLSGLSHPWTSGHWCRFLHTNYTCMHVSIIYCIWIYDICTYVYIYTIYTVYIHTYITLHYITLHTYIHFLSRWMHIERVFFFFNCRSIHFKRCSPFREFSWGVFLTPDELEARPATGDIKFHCRCFQPSSSSSSWRWRSNMV